MSRAPSETTRLLRAGLRELARARSILAEEWLAPIVDDDDAESRGAATPETLLAALAGCADPDQALLTLSWIYERAGAGERARLVDVLRMGGPGRERLLAVLGSSAALGDLLVRHPEELGSLTDPGAGWELAEISETLRERLLLAVGADPTDPAPVAELGQQEGAPGAGVAAATDALRRAYRRELLRIAAADLTQPDPAAALPQVAALLADLAGAALEAALAIARAQVTDSELVRIAVIGMGKTGGRELNYISDVDVVYVAEPALSPDGEPLVSEERMLKIATQLAGALARVCSAPSGEPALWEVDAALRPEGKNGPLVRTLASHVAYYERWAKTWEFQALLKARPVAGDVALGEAYVAALNPLVWTAVQREHFVEDAQAMRRRVESHIPRKDVDRELKLGAGGLRDVEFTVQLLQLVHGRLAPGIRSRTTLEAIAALAREGFIGRPEAERLAQDYRFLRLMEHRIQLYRLRRTHLVPSDERDLERLSRSMRLERSDRDVVIDLLHRWRTTRLDVRGLHEDLFYRPLLPATAQLSAEDAALSPEAARARLEALGYRSPDQALAHIAALTEGVSRRAAIQRQLLPVLLGWFTRGADPDAGLLAFRTLSDELGGSHWYLRLLRDSGQAAQNLALVLSSSRYAADALRRSPESVQWLAEEGDLQTRSVAALDAEAEAGLRRREETGTVDEAATFVRYLRRRELARAAVADVLTNLEADLTPGISDAADAALRATLQIASEQVRAEMSLPLPPTRLLIVAMGRLGGREAGYASDADVMFVHDPLPDADPALAQRFALAVAQRVTALLGQTGPEPPLKVDADLRPEGRNGPLTRTLAAYREYYGRWSAPWERQALLRARPVAGDDALALAFLELIDPVRYAPGMTESELREFRRVKARVERERMPRGVVPTRHLKFGPGGLADVEWVAQLLQLQHAHDVPALRTTSTLDALEAAADAGLLSRPDADVLSRAWRSSTRTRDAIVLVTGRTTGSKVDVLPGDHRDLTATAALLGYVPVSGAALEEDYLRTARHARKVVERLVFGE